MLKIKAIMSNAFFFFKALNFKAVIKNDKDQYLQISLNLKKVLSNIEFLSEIQLTFRNFIFFILYCFIKL